MPLFFVSGKKGGRAVGKSIGLLPAFRVSLGNLDSFRSIGLIGIYIDFTVMYRLQKLYQKPDGKLSSWKNPSHAMWLCVFVRTCLQGSYLEISWFRNRRFWRSVKCWDVDSVHPLDGKCQDQYQLTFLTFLTCGNMTARDFFFFGDLLKKPCGFRWREMTFFFERAAYEINMMKMWVCLIQIFDSLFLS